MSFKKSLLAFTGVAALSAVAFAPSLPSAEPAVDGKAVAASLGQSFDAGPVAAGMQNLPCVADMSGPFACNNVDLIDNVPTAGWGGAHGSDSWGWTDDDGTEYVIVTSGEGTGFFRLGEDGTAGYLGSLDRARASADGILWNDVKVVNDHAYVTAEDARYGVQIVDMNKVAELDVTDLSLDGAREIAEDAWLTDANDTLAGHNLVAFPELDILGVVLGEHTGADGEASCGGNLVLYDVSETPLAPQYLGCGAPQNHLNYVDTPHDAQCVVYEGPDADYNGAGEDELLGTADDTDARIVCALFNQYDGGTILVDATDVVNGTSQWSTFINKFTYATMNYAHQGWFTANHEFILFNDELDEAGAAATAAGGVLGGAGAGNRNLMTTTYVIDVSDLDVVEPGKNIGMPNADFNESLVKAWSNENTLAIDHNMYPVEIDPETGRSLLYQANYGAGLRVLEFDDESLRGPAEDMFTEVAYYDTYPGPGPSEFYGAWNVYPFFESGMIVLSDFQSGLLILDVDDTLEGRG